MGRDLRHLVNIVHNLTAREIGLKILTGQRAAVDTTTAQGKLVFGIFAAFTEFQRELTSERTKAVLESARARGRKEAGCSRWHLRSCAWRWHRWAS